MIPGNEGDLTGVPCPWCGGEIVYNGNYFCENWSRKPIEQHECGWALSHDDDTGEPVTVEDRHVWRQLKEAYAPLRDYLTNPTGYLERRREERW